MHDNCLDCTECSWHRCKLPLRSPVTACLRAGRHHGLQGRCLRPLHSQSSCRSQQGPRVLRQRSCQPWVQIPGGPTCQPQGRTRCPSQLTCLSPWQRQCRLPSFLSPGTAPTTQNQQPPRQASSRCLCRPWGHTLRRTRQRPGSMRRSWTDRARRRRERPPGDLAENAALKQTEETALKDRQAFSTSESAEVGLDRRWLGKRILPPAEIGVEV